jgi:predicted ATPase
VELFCQRARLERSPEVAELCARLDNLPLAVELAAARTSVLSPAQILERLSQRLDLLKGGRDADPRQQTLRATIEWSYDLLTTQEQQLFARLSVFAGGCTLEAAEEVCEADLDTLQSLVEKSLLRLTNERYCMLETIREYAGELLREGGEATELDDQHARYYLVFSERLDTDEREGRLSNAAMRAAFWPERTNALAALEHFEREQDHECELRLGGILGWGSSLNPRQGADRFRRLMMCEDIPDKVRARALQTAVVIARWQGDYGWAREIGGSGWICLGRSEMNGRS